MKGGVRPLYLRSLELQGFKSFPDHTRLTFEEGITAVVGPNGSGKSNISDAVRWVLGEQSTKALRGGKMEDVIFGGTTERRRQGFAQVTLTLDNETGRFPLEDSQIDVTRRYYRSGESEYYINRHPVRLRDVHDLFRDTGLGQEGYSLISQGKIDEILSVKGEKRREIFEEAAGISRFRHRKEEAQRKLQHTEENLRRILDKLEELELQVEPLRVQADKAKQYLLWRDELRVLEISLWMDRLERLQDTLDQGEAARRQGEQALQAAQQEAQALYDQAQDVARRISRWERRGETLRQRAAKAEEEKSHWAGQISVLEVRLQNNADNAARLGRDMAEREARALELEGRAQERRTRLDDLAEELASSRLAATGEPRQAAQMEEDLVRRAAERVAVCQAQERAAAETVTRLTMETRRLTDKRQLLSEMARMYEGYSRAVKTVMGQAGQGGLTGIHGPVGGLLTLPSKYTVAVETALGGALGHLVVDNEEAGKAVLEFLKRRDGGRITCLPLDAIRPAALREKGLEEQPGFIGIASELIQRDPVYRDIFANLLGRVVVVEDLERAIPIARRYDRRFRVVTLDGQVLHPGGSMTGGSASRTGGQLSRAGELAGLEERIIQNRTELSQAEQRAAEAQEATLRGVTDLETARREAAARRGQAETSLGEARIRLANLEAEDGQLRRSLAELEQLAGELRQGLARQGEELAKLQEERAQLDGALLAGREALAQRQEEALACQKKLAGFGQTKLTLEKSRNEAEKAAREQNEVLLRLQKETAVLEQRVLTATMEREQILSRMWETYQVSHEMAQTIRVPLQGGARQKIQELKGNMESLGGVNLGAVEEYRRVNDRYQFLAGQKADVEQAKAGMEKIIGEITEQMREIFQREFSAINAAFGETFSQLFPGGQGALELDDPADVLGCGIEIQAKLPGKSLRVLSLLSGGEKAFVSIALYFAMLKVRPTPFCVMDEIEAALDDANVERFATYLRGMCEKTQFIVITHRRGTMEEADVLYGVTMEEQGVSRLLRLSLAQATAALEGETQP